MRLRTIAPVDMTRQERVAFSQALARQRRQARRRSKGKKPRAEYLAKSLSQTKPWLARNISRSTWYRRGKPTARSGDTGVDTIKISNASTRPVPPSTGMGGDRGGRAGLRPAGPRRPEVFSSESSLSLSNMPALPDLCPGEDSQRVSLEERQASEKVHEHPASHPQNRVFQRFKTGKTNRIQF